MYLGTSFAPRQAQWFGLDPVKTLEQVTRLGFSHIRLGAYWDEIEEVKSTFDFSSLQWQIEMCQKAGVQVVLVVGSKSPRWPEFFEPSWAQELSDEEYQSALLHFVSETVRWAQQFSCISHWQVENEPLDSSGPERRVIDLRQLQQEINMVRSTDKKELSIIVTAWGNELRKRQSLSRLSSLTHADIIGIDLYPKMYWKTVLGKDWFLPRFGIFPGLTGHLLGASRPIWVSELQAEPWEKSSSEFRSAQPQSMSPSLLIQNWQWATSLPVSAVFLWGCEYWVWRAQQGDSRYLEVVRSLATHSIHQQ